MLSLWRGRSRNLLLLFASNFAMFNYHLNLYSHDYSWFMSLLIFLLFIIKMIYSPLAIRYICIYNAMICLISLYKRIYIYIYINIYIYYFIYIYILLFIYSLHYLLFKTLFFCKVLNYTFSAFLKIISITLSQSILGAFSKTLRSTFCKSNSQLYVNEKQELPWLYILTIMAYNFWWIQLFYLGRLVYVVLFWILPVSAYFSYIIFYAPYHFEKMKFATGITMNYFSYILSCRVIFELLSICFFKREQ